MNRGQSCSPYFLRPFPLSLNSQRLLPPREHQLHPSHYLAGDQPAPGPLGKPAGAGTGPQDSGRRHGRGKPQPLSAGLSVVVRFGSSPHPVAAPSGPSSQDPLSRSPASGQATSSEHRQPPRQAPPAGVPGSSARPDQCASARENRISILSGLSWYFLQTRRECSRSDSAIVLLPFAIWM